MIESMTLDQEPEEKAKTFGQFIQKQREACSLSRLDVARKINVDHQTLWSIENSVRLPFAKQETLLALANVLNVPKESLIQKAISERVKRKKVTNYIKIDVNDLSQTKRQVITMIKMLIIGMSEEQAKEMLESLFKLHEKNLAEGVYANRK